MKKRLFTILFLLFVVLKYPNTAAAVNCNASVMNVCGTSGGCRTGEWCRPDGDGGYKCFVQANPDVCPQPTADDPPGLRCGQTDTLDVCGSVAGCPAGQKCTNRAGGTGRIVPPTCIRIAGECGVPETVNTGTPGTCNIHGLGQFGPDGGCEDYLERCTKRRTGLSYVYECIVDDVIKPPTCTGSNGEGFPTALGCIAFDTLSIAAQSTIFLVGISGGLALVLFGWASIRIMFSGGLNQQTLADAKDSYGAVIAGLLMLAASAFLYKVIGQQVLGIF